MKDYLKEYLSEWSRQEISNHSQDSEVPKVTEDHDEPLQKAFGTFGTYRGVADSDRLDPQLVVLPSQTFASEPEIAWRVEAMLPQIPDTGAIPFLVARGEIEPQAGCCLSCGEESKPGETWRCAACVRAANLALELSLSRGTSKEKEGKEKEGKEV